MAERLEHGNIFDIPKAGAVQSIYPWDEWMDGSCWILTRGEDFHSSIVSFSGGARSVAKRQGKRLVVRRMYATDAEGNKIEKLAMQFFPLVKENASQVIDVPAED